MFLIFLIFLNILCYFLISYDYYNILGLNILFFNGAY
ncbi:rhomboid family intramembrane serine protease, partial [Campylobacter jejuni]